MNSNKQDQKVSREEFHKRRQQIIDNAKAQIDGVISGAKQQVAEISKKIEDGAQIVESSAIEIEKELLKQRKTAESKNIDFSHELLRKTVHFISLVIPIAYIFLDRETTLLILIPVMLVFVIADIATKRIAFLRVFYLRIFGSMLRKHEIKKKRVLLNGASWVLISSVLTIFIFPKIIAIVALSVLIVADIFAALIGRKYGKKSFLGIKNKSQEGTLAFFVTAFIVVVIYGLVFRLPLLYYVAGLFSSFIAAIAEALAKEVLRTDDNLAIPISFGISMWFVDALCRYFWQIEFIEYANLLLS